MPAKAVTLRALDGDPDEMAQLQHVLEGAPTYAERHTGAPPGPADAQSLYTILPEGKTYDDKFVYGIFVGDTMVGCIDVVRGYPDPPTAYLGLLLVSESHQRRGIGRRAYAALERIVAQWGTCHQIQLAVLRTNADVLPFWTRLGFRPTGQTRPYRYGPIETEAIVLVKALPPT